MPALSSLLSRAPPRLRRNRQEIDGVNTGEPSGGKLQIPESNQGSEAARGLISKFGLNFTDLHVWNAEILFERFHVLRRANVN